MMNETVPPPDRSANAYTASLLPGIIVIVVGTLFLLSSLGAIHIPIWSLWRLWPLFLIGLGAMNMMRRQWDALIWGFATALFGLGLLLDNFGLLPFHGWQLWPIFLVALGVHLLVAPNARTACSRGARHAGAREQRQWHVATPTMSVGPGQPLHLMAICSEAHGRVTSSDLARGEAFSMFGLCKVDLRSMGMPGSPVTIDASSIFGAVEIYIPSTWDVMLRGVGVFGTYQDETLRQSPIEGSGVRRGLLIVQGVCFFAAVTVKN